MGFQESKPLNAPNQQALPLAEIKKSPNKTNPRGKWVKLWTPGIVIDRGPSYQPLVSLNKALVNQCPSFPETPTPRARHSHGRSQRNCSLFWTPNQVATQQFSPFFFASLDGFFLEN